MVLILLVFLITTSFVVALPFLIFYLFREWQFNNNSKLDAYADNCLIATILLLLLLFFGRKLFALLLSKKGKQEKGPHNFQPLKRDALKRPDGSLINIEYYGKEKGQAIIFIHGWNANSKNWFYQKEYFEKNYRLIMMDLAGQGRSTRPRNKDFSLPKMAADLEAVIEFTGVKDPILWGHSIGGMTVLSLVTKRIASGIRGIILQHTTYSNPLKTIIFDRLFRAIQKPVVIPVCYLMIFLSPLFWVFSWLSFLSGNSHILARFFLFAGNQTPKQLDFTAFLSALSSPAVTARGILGMLNYDVTNRLQDIRLPTLIIASDKDRLTKPEASSFMHNKIQGSKLILLSTSNHQGLMERATEVNRSAEDFINSIE